MHACNSLPPTLQAEPLVRVSTGNGGRLREAQASGAWPPPSGRPALCILMGWPRASGRPPALKTAKAVCLPTGFWNLLRRPHWACPAGVTRKSRRRVLAVRAQDVCWGATQAGAPGPAFGRSSAWVWAYTVARAWRLSPKGSGAGRPADRAVARPARLRGCRRQAPRVK